MPIGWRSRFPAVYGPCRSPTAVCAQYVPKFSAALAGVAEGFLNAPLGDGVLPVKALVVDLEQDGDAVAGPLGDLGGRDAAVEPCRDARAPQVVHAAR
jgi:hypothetical protein